MARLIQRNTILNFQPLSSVAESGMWAKKAFLQLGGKLIFNGGQPITPLATNQEGYSRIPTLDETTPYSLDTRTYFRPDLRLAYRRNGAKSASTVALDIQNCCSYEIILTAHAANMTRRPINGWILFKAASCLC